MPFISEGNSPLSSHTPANHSFYRTGWANLKAIKICQKGRAWVLKQLLGHISQRYGSLRRKSLARPPRLRQKGVFHKEVNIRTISVG